MHICITAGCGDILPSLTTFERYDKDHTIRYTELSDYRLSITTDLISLSIKIKRLIFPDTNSDLMWSRQLKWYACHVRVCKK